MRQLAPFAHVKLALVGLALVSLLAVGCAQGRFDPYHKGVAFDDAQKQFTQALRWNQLALASSLVEEESRERFVGDAESFAGLRFTDYEVLVNELDDDLNHATVDVMFFAYSRTTMLESSITVHQEWERDAETGRWWVKPEVRYDALPANAGTTP